MERIGALFKLALFAIFVVFIFIFIGDIFQRAYIKYSRGEPDLLFLLSGLFIFFLIFTVSYSIKNEKLGEKIRFLPKIICYLVAISVAIIGIIWILWLVFNLLILPYTDTDATIDTDIVTFKSGFVKFIIIIIEVILASVLINILTTIKKNKRQ